jgi:hypothetical protein
VNRSRRNLIFFFETPGYPAGAGRPVEVLATSSFYLVMLHGQCIPFVNLLRALPLNCAQQGSIHFETPG